MFIKNFGVVMLVLGLNASAFAAKPLKIKEVLRDQFVPRKVWDTSKRDYKALETTGALSLDDKRDMAILHHSASSMPSQPNLIPQQVESVIANTILRYHVLDRAWADVGYHFMIGGSGKVYEGRPLKYEGAHALGFNKHSVGIAFLGCFDAHGCKEENKNLSSVSDDMIESTARLLAFLSIREGFELTVESVMARNLLDLKKKGKTQFPHSPGNLILEKMDTILLQAKDFRRNFEIMQHLKDSL